MYSSRFEGIKFYEIVKGPDAKYIRPLGGMLVLCLAVGMLGQIAMLLQPKYAETLIHASQSKADLTVPLAALVALLAGAALSAMIQQMLLAKMSEGMAEDIRSQLARSFFSLPVLTQESRSPGWYSQRISNDVDLVKRIPGQFVSVVQSVFVMILSLTEMPPKGTALKCE